MATSDCQRASKPSMPSGIYIIVIVLVLENLLLIMPILPRPRLIGFIFLKDSSWNFSSTAMSAGPLT